MDKEFHYKNIKPEKSISEFVESFWMLEYKSDQEKEWAILPDGRIDIVFMKPFDEPIKVDILGIETQPKIAVLKSKFIMFVISFNLLAVEYIFRKSFAHLLDNTQNLPSNFWDFSPDDINNFDLFCTKVTQKIQSFIPENIDNRKQKLFDLLYSCNGEITINELSEKIGWSSRQMNRYFKQQFGLSVKAYCDILRFKSTFQHIRDGNLFPDGNFSDQSHFIREVKKLSGTLPKKLSQNENDRFIQLSTIPKK